MPTGKEAPDRRRRQAPPPALVVQRLLLRYERHLRGEPPIVGLDADGAVATMRRERAALGALGGGRAGLSARH